MATGYLMQRLAMAIQRGNVGAVLGSLGHASNNDHMTFFHLSSIFFFTFLHPQIALFYLRLGLVVIATCIYSVPHHSSATFLSYLNQVFITTMTINFGIYLL